MKLLVPFLSIGFFCFIIWIITLANTGQSSIFFDLVARIPYGDKVGHFCLFGVLTFAANFSFKLKTINLASRNIYLGALLVFIFVVFEELSQYFIASRTLDFFDFSANIFGIVFFSLVTKHIQHNSRVKKTKKYKA